MSKKLEEAYKEYTQAQIPDLWDRIEAELPEKKAVSKKNSREKLLRKRVLATSAAAACLCLVVAGSGIYHLIAGKNVDEMVATESNFGITADKIMTEEAACDTAESVETEVSIDENSEAEMTVTEKMDTDDSMSASESQGAQTEGARDTSEESTRTEECTQTKANSYDVVVTISDMENTGEEMLYYGVIVSATDRLMEVDGKVTFCISEDAFEPFETGKTYSLRLTEREMQGMEIRPYLVTAVYGEQ